MKTQKPPPYAERDSSCPLPRFALIRKSLAILLLLFTSACDGDPISHDGASQAKRLPTKHDILKYFAARGRPLREIEHNGGYIDAMFQVGPNYDYAVGMSFFETAAERGGFRPLEYPIPGHVSNNVVLWFWNVDTNGTPGYKEFFDEIEVLLDEYPLHANP